MDQRIKMLLPVLGVSTVALGIAGCVETAPEIAISEPDPELVFMRGKPTFVAIA